jgi:hypothetical protein
MRNWSGIAATSAGAPSTAACAGAAPDRATGRSPSCACAGSRSTSCAGSACAGSRTTSCAGSPSAARSAHAHRKCWG